MKNFITVMTVLFLLVTSSSWNLKANPFANKLGNVVIKKENQETINLEFMGYAIMENQRFAIVQLNNQQHILKKGESLGKIKIIRFSADSLYYRFDGIIYKAPINKAIH